MQPADTDRRCHSDRTPPPPPSRRFGHFSMGAQVSVSQTGLLRARGGEDRTSLLVVCKAGAESLLYGAPTSPMAMPKSLRPRAGEGRSRRQRSLESPPPESRPVTI